MVAMLYPHDSFGASAGLAPKTIRRFVLGMNLGINLFLPLSYMFEINSLIGIFGLLLAPIIVSGPHNLKHTETRIAAGFFVRETILALRVSVLTIYATRAKGIGASADKAR
jgi:hypothetical protein